MKIRILRRLETMKGKLEPGTILDITPKTAAQWVAEGDAAYVGKAESSENKMVEPSENKRKTMKREA